MKTEKIPASIAVESSITDIDSIQQSDRDDVNMILTEYAKSGGDVGALTAAEATKIILDKLSELNTETISVSSEGSIVVSGSRIELVYSEDEESGMEGCETRIVFDRGNPGLVTMIRSGMGNASLVFDSSDRRQHCVYDVGIGDPMQLCVVTQRIENTVTEKGGSIELEYLIEINGITAEYSRVSITVKPFDNTAQSSATVIEYDLP